MTGWCAWALGWACLTGAAAPARPDRDGDGVPDSIDQCPDEPEDLDGFADQDGCPDLDNDGDTIVDAADRCPNEAGDVKAHGCPVGDRDGDGVPDTADLCPDVPENIDGIRDGDGCPEESTDPDGDGIEGALDACPLEPEDKDGYADADGCPDPDNDLDTVMDVDDACPLQPGPPSRHGCPATDRDGDGVVDELDRCPELGGPPPTGCPKKVLVTRTALKIELAVPIGFVGNSATIDPGGQSAVVLDQVSSLLRANPQREVTVEGHTDEEGSAATNLLLSDDRAAAVRAALVSRGVDGARVRAIGYGKSRPLVAGHSAVARRKNCRIDFVFVPGPQER